MAEIEQDRSVVMSNPNGGKRNKRGMKPRSQRNRKRARQSQEEPINYKFTVAPLKLNDEILSPDTFVRMIEPYPYTFATFAKARWIGRTVLDVYCSEFGAYPKSYYVSAIGQGRIKVSEEQVDLEHKIKGHDVLSHTVHRHEPGVVISGPLQDSITVVAETDDLVIVDKPGTLPVHPCGAYQQNSLVPMLAPRYGKLHTIQRLDRLTSGLVLLAKTSKVAQRWGKALMERETCEKTYVARVKGKFPKNCPADTLPRIHSDENGVDGTAVKYGVYSSVEVVNEKEVSVEQQRKRNATGFWISDRSQTLDKIATIDDVLSSELSVDEWLDTDSSGEKKARWLHLTCPTRIANHKDGVCEAGSFEDLPDEVYAKSVKPAQTAFGVVRYDEETDSTILICRPSTGRTHQIRLHLQYLGHAIANDPCYGGELWYGNERGKAACEKAAAKLQELNGAACAKKEGEVATISDTPATEEEIATLAKVSRDDDEPLDEFIKKTCVWCARSGGNDADRTMLEILVRSRGIWLHALRYKMADSKGNKLDHATKIPSWC